LRTPLFSGPSPLPLSKTLHRLALPARSPPDPFLEPPLFFLSGLHSLLEPPFPGRPFFSDSPLWSEDSPCYSLNFLLPLFLLVLSSLPPPPFPPPRHPFPPPPLLHVSPLPIPPPLFLSPLPSPLLSPPSFQVSNLLVLPPPNLLSSLVLSAQVCYLRFSLAWFTFVDFQAFSWDFFPPQPVRALRPWILKCPPQTRGFFTGFDCPLRLSERPCCLPFLQPFVLSVELVCIQVFCLSSRFERSDLSSFI